MRKLRTVILIRSIITALVAALAVVALANGRVLVGLLLAALVVANVAMLLTIRRRRRRVRERLQARFEARRADDLSAPGPGSWRSSRSAAGT
jgi:O-antigen/teichoic acid export membrane protein